jgi:hypothetical protein
MTINFGWRLQLRSIACLNFDQSCNNAQRSFINDAYDDAMELAREAETAAMSGNGDIFRRWFGNSNRNTVHGIFANMSESEVLLRLGNLVNKHR